MPERTQRHGRLLATRKARQNALQAVVLTALALLVWMFLSNLIENLSADGARIDFSFLLNESGFDVNETLIAYDAGSSYLSALLVGALNTVHLTLVGLVCSTAIGVMVGLLQLGDIKILRILCRLYVDSMRNLPKLLILLAVYVLLVLELPVAREAISFFDLAFLSNRGLNFPAVEIDYGLLTEPRTLLAAALFLLAFSLAWLAVRRLIKGIFLRRFLPILFLVAGLILTTGVVGFDIPEFAGFNFEGGSVVSIPFLSLAVALSVYHGAQVAEVVRSGIQSVPKGQVEAGRALGLTPSQISWLIVLPLALRVMIPPLTNQYLNLLKNTSIGLAVGYSDLVSIMNTSINQTFRPVELMLVTMTVYLVIGIAASVALNVFNRRVQLRER